jgi:hypothetical protein
MLLLVLASTLSLPLFANAAMMPPDETFLIIQSKRAASGTDLHFLQANYRSGKVKEWVSLPKLQQRLFQFAVIENGAGAGLPWFAGIASLTGDADFGDVVVVKTDTNHPSLRNTLIQARAVVPFNPWRALVAGKKNELFLLSSDGHIIDLNGAAKFIADSTWLDSGKYGSIQRMQLRGSDEVVLLTESHLLVVALTDDNGQNPTIRHAINYSSKIGRHEFSAESPDLVAGPKSAWVNLMVRLTTSSSPIPFWTNKLALLDYATGNIVTEVTVPPSVGDGDVELLEMDTKSQDVLVRERNNYVRYDSSGAKSVEQHDVFSTAALSILNSSLTHLPSPAKWTVDHPKGGQHWVSRAKQGIFSTIGGAAQTAQTAPTTTSAPKNAGEQRYFEFLKIFFPSAKNDHVSMSEFLRVLDGNNVALRDLMLDLGETACHKLGFEVLANGSRGETGSAISLSELAKTLNARLSCAKLLSSSH